jgi:thymidylate synthase
MHNTDKQNFFTSTNYVSAEEQYLSLLRDILISGEHKTDRTGTGTISVFGRTMRINLQKEFPALTTKKLAWKAVVGELLWFLEGSNDERRLAELTHGTRDSEKTTIWSGNANASYWKPKAKFDGDVGNIYGVQWRKWPKTSVEEYGNYTKHGENGFTFFDAKVKITYIDQLEKLINSIKNNPTDRRMILSAYNVSELDNMSLPPCHVMAQFNVNVNTGTLNCLMTQRSVDVFLGLPFNIASYALLTHMLAQVAGLKAGELIMSLGDTHIYQNHVEQVQEQLTRGVFPAPQLLLNPSITDIDKFSMEDINLVNYESHPAIKAPMAV